MNSLLGNFKGMGNKIKHILNGHNCIGHLRALNGCLDLFYLPEDGMLGVRFCTSPSTGTSV